MKYKKSIFTVLYLCLLFFIACDDNSVGTLTDGVYNYVAYDSLGVIVAKGTLTIKFKDSTNVTGEWEIKKVGDPQNIGPQTGSGELEGTFNDGVLALGLNPGYVDNNVFLEGEPENNKYEGKWSWISFRGFTNWGRFQAEKE